jgi:hypothetical protein
VLSSRQSANSIALMFLWIVSTMLLCLSMNDNVVGEFFALLLQSLVVTVFTGAEDSHPDCDRVCCIALPELVQLGWPTKSMGRSGIHVCHCSFRSILGEVVCADLPSDRKIHGGSSSYPHYLHVW